MNLADLPPLPPLSDSRPRLRVSRQFPEGDFVLVLVDVLNGATERVTVFPHTVSDAGFDGRGVSLEFVPLHSGMPGIGKIAGGEKVLLNGVVPEESVELEKGQVYTLQVGRRLSVFQIDPEGDWPPRFEAGAWQVFDAETGEFFGVASPGELFHFVSGQGLLPERCAVCPEGLDVGFHLGRAAEVFRVSEEAACAGTADKGAHVCPVCWLHFDAGDALSIAVHEALHGDPVLGAESMLRFHPTRFNDVGQAIDPMGLVCTELACPHCRRRLPPGFLELPHKIFSLIGAPSSGKSYFLSVLTKVLHDNLPRDFNLVFKDGDPSGNMLLNQMRNKLFSGATPEECVLGKTAMEGATYEKINRFGNRVAMPLPFIYRLGHDAQGRATDSAVVFYDNAGEHFEPGLDMNESPGALHVVSSAGIFFLYDPTSSPVFRKKLADVQDPQLSQHGRIDQQDSILAEMEVRVKRMLGLAPADKIPVPVAVLIGKCDVWQTLFDAHALPSPVKAGRLDGAIIDGNSARLREFLALLCPGLVAQAETLSNDVRYFAVSSLGHSPAPIAGGPNAGMLAPDPARLAPFGIEAPAYWLFSKAFPGLLN